MVTVKRKIKNDVDRYGGYGVELKTPDADPSIEIGDSFNQYEYKRAQESVNYTSTATATPPPAPQRQPITENKAETAEKVADPTPDEFMPRINREKHDEEREQEQVSVKKQKIDGRTKLVLGIYVSVILILSALVIATGIALSSTGARVNSLESELDAQNAIVARQIEELSRLSDEDAIRGRAYENGMERVESSQSIELLPMGEAKTYEGTTNWFDSFCDWLSGVFGG